MMRPFPAPSGFRAARWSAFSDETIARPRGARLRVVRGEFTHNAKSPTFGRGHPARSTGVRSRASAAYLMRPHGDMATPRSAARSARSALRGRPGTRRSPQRRWGSRRMATRRCGHIWNGENGLWRPSWLVSDSYTTMWPHLSTASVRARGAPAGRRARPTSGAVASIRVLWRCSAHTILPTSRGAARTRDRFVAEGAPPRSPEARRRGEGPHHRVALAWEGWPHDDVAKLSATCACGIRCGVADLRARSLKGGTSAPWAWRVNAGCWCGLSSGP